ncbi:NB-ARC domain-containing protein [Streptomyces sp. NPDC101118]|uniref:NB-ARC domain-containing protein n=1 Tax=Streptomyces sp. NPDC101118 TaxID=3366109 RepID=UPI00380A3AAC
MRGAGKTTTLAVLGAVLAVLASLAANAATSADRWPGPLDLLRRHSWTSVGALALLAVVVAVVTAVRGDGGAAPAGDPPPPAPPSVPEWVVDRREGARAVAAVCRPPRRGARGRGRAGRRTVGITTSLDGAGGFGKTTLATVVRASGRVRRHFRGRVYTVTIGRDVRGRAAVAAKVAEVTRFITGDTTAFDDPALAGAHLGRLLDQRPRTLLVLDDVWEPEQLEPFLLGGAPCVRLVTTRVPAVLPPGTQRVRVDEMSPAQARAVLTHGLPPLPPDTVTGLLHATGRWALLLRLTNRLVARRIATGGEPADVARAVLRALRDRGPAAVDGPPAPRDTPLDLDDPARRAQAVRATVEAATTLLSAGGARRLAELAVFAEDEAVPVPLVARLWAATGGLDEEAVRALCAQLDALSLVALNPERGGRISLHDVLRDYLRSELGASELRALHGLLVDTARDGLAGSDADGVLAGAPGAAVSREAAGTAPAREPAGPARDRPRPAPWDLPDGYLHDHLVEHLLGAGRTAGAEALAGDLRWVESRLLRRGPTAPWADLDRIPTASAAALARDITRVAHLLTPTEPAGALVQVLHSRLAPLPHWGPQVAAREPLVPRPRLGNRWDPPDLPEPALRRTLLGHDGGVTGLAASPDGEWLASVGLDGTVRRWDARSGRELDRRDHEHPLTALAVAPDGTWLAAGDAHGAVLLWYVERGGPLVRGVRPVPGGGPVRTLAAVPRSNGVVWLAVLDAAQRVVTLWDPATCRNTGRLEAEEDVAGFAAAPDGSLLATTHLGGRTRRWDGGTLSEVGPRSGGGTTTWTRVAVVPGGERTERVARVPAASGPAAGAPPMLLVGAESGSTALDGCDHAGRERHPGGHEGPVLALAAGPHGRWLASGGQDGTVRFWTRHDGVGAADGTRDGAAAAGRTRNGGVRTELRAHAGQVDALAVAPDGEWLASAGSDGAVRIWDAPVTGGAGAPRAEGPAAHPERRTDGRAAHPERQTDGRAAHPERRTDGRVPYPERRVEGPGAPRQQGTGRAAAGRHPGAGRSEPLALVAVEADGARFLTADRHRGTVRIWHLVRGGSEYHPRHDSSERWLAVTPGGAPVSLDSYGIVSVAGSLLEQPRPVSACALSGDGHWLAAADDRGTVRLFDLRTGTGLRDYRPGPPDGVTGGSRDRSAVVRTHEPRRPAPAFAAAFARDGGRYATADADGVVRVRDRETGRCAEYRGFDHRPGPLALAPDGSWLACGDGPDVRLWRDGAGVLLCGHTGTVLSLAASPDGAWLASTADDGALRIWDAVSGRAVALLRTEGPLPGCDWTPDSRTVVAVGQWGPHVYAFEPPDAGAVVGAGPCGPVG